MLICEEPVGYAAHFLLPYPRFWVLIYEYVYYEDVYWEVYAHRVMRSTNFWFCVEFILRPKRAANMLGLRMLCINISIF